MQFVKLKKANQSCIANNISDLCVRSSLNRLVDPNASHCGRTLAEKLAGFLPFITALVSEEKKRDRRKKIHNKAA